MPINRSAWHGSLFWLFPAGQTPPSPWLTPSRSFAASHPLPWAGGGGPPLTRRACSSWRQTCSSSINRARRCSWPNEFGALAFQTPPCPWGLSFPHLGTLPRAQRQAPCLSTVFRAGVLPSLAAPPRSAFTSTEEVWHFRLPGWPMVTLAASRKYGDIKVPRSRADEMDSLPHAGISQPPLSPPLFLLTFFFKKTFLETLITAEGCCKAGRNIDHFYSVVRRKV